MFDIVEQKTWHSVILWKEYMFWFNYELVNHFMICEILETFPSRGFWIRGTKLSGFTSTWYRSSTFSVFNRWLLLMTEFPFQICLYRYSSHGQHFSKNRVQRSMSFFTTFLRDEFQEVRSTWERTCWRNRDFLVFKIKYKDGLQFQGQLYAGISPEFNMLTACLVGSFKLLMYNFFDFDTPNIIFLDNRHKFMFGLTSGFRRQRDLVLDELILKGMARWSAPVRIQMVGKQRIRLTCDKCIRSIRYEVSRFCILIIPSCELAFHVFCKRKAKPFILWNQKETDQLEK